MNEDKISPNPDPAPDDYGDSLIAELRSVAARSLRSDQRNQTLQATALIHEAWIRLEQAGAKPNDRGHLLALASTVIRQILIDHSRRKHAEKRGGSRAKVELNDDAGITPQSHQPQPVDLLAVHEALHDLAQFGPRQAQVVEMKFFGGLTVPEIAEALGMSERTIASDWAAARAWLHDCLST